jgi:hypothetical protein
MIVVLVYRPEAVSGAGLGERPHEEDPFEGVEVFGIFYKAEEKWVMEYIDSKRKENPGWRFHLEETTLKVGLIRGS